jgi:hypothetical protein
MKKFTNIILTIPLVLLIWCLAESCGKDSDVGYECETITLQGETIKVCCDEDDCYYEWNGKKYYCDGHDCEDAAKRLADDILGNSPSADKDDRYELINKLHSFAR